MARDIDIEAVTRHYLVTAAWAETAHTGEGQPDDEMPLDNVMSERGIDWTDEARALAEKDCRAFVAKAIADHGPDVFDEVEDDEMIGHDFWLTRKHHGAGFWDGDWPKMGDKLTETASTFSESIYPYVGDDDAVHFDGYQ